MIISHKHKFIFVKTAKVAGTSIELALRPFLGTNDISTPVVWYDEQYAKNNNIPPPQNYEKYYDKKAQQFAGRGMLHEHSWAYEVRGIVGDKLWNEYFVFTVDRDPLEKSLSKYFHYRRKEDSEPKVVALIRYLRWLACQKGVPKGSAVANFVSLERWMALDAEFEFSQNFYRYSVDNAVIVDKVYSQSNLLVLQKELGQIVGGELCLPRLKVGVNKVQLSDERKSILREILLRGEVYQKELMVLAGNWSAGNPL